MDPGKVTELFKLYKVGTAKLWNGSTIFWQIDSQSRIRSGKIMAYDNQTGHRIKDNSIRVTWVHSYLKLEDFNLRQCFFGEHLLQCFPDKPVAIVESEKSALIASYFMPELLWIATGGSNGCFNSDAVKVLKSRSVILVPDLGMMEKWAQKLPLLEHCSSVFITDRLEKMATENQIKRGLDIADFLEEFAKIEAKKTSDFDKKPPSEWSDKEVLEHMIQENPYIKTMMEELDLVLVPSEK